MILKAGELIPVYFLNIELEGKKIRNCFLVDTEKEELHCYRTLENGDLMINQLGIVEVEVIKVPKNKLHVYVVKPE